MSKTNKSQLTIGVILGYVNILLGNLIPFFYTPVMLELLGKSEYGLYKLANTATSYLALISFGIGASVTRYLIKARTEEGKEAEERIFGLFNVFFTIISALAVVAGVVLAFTFEHIYDEALTPNEIERMRILILIITANTAVGLSASSYNAVVTSHERFLFLQIVNIITTCIAPILNIVALYMGYASIGMTIVSLAIGVVTRVMFLVYVRKNLELKPRYGKMPTYLIKEILVFSFWVFVGQIVNQLYQATDTMIIGAVPSLGTDAVAVYNIGAVFTHIVSSLSAAISNILTPKANKMVFSNASNEEITSFVTKIGRYQSFIVALVCSGFVAFGVPFVEWYAGEEYWEAYWVAVLIMVPLYIPLVQSVCLSIVTAKNEHKYRSIVYLIIAVFNAILSYFLIIEYGIIGAAAVTGVSYILGPGLVMNLFYHRKLKINMFYFWKRILGTIWIPVIMCVATIFLGDVLDFRNKSVLLAGIGIYTLLYCIFTYLFALDKEEKSFVTSFIKKFTRAKKAQ